MPSAPESPSSTKYDRPPMVVGLGASAGGLKALEAFFANISPGQPLAFAVVTHTSAARVSMLPEILSRQCVLPVEEVTSRRMIRPDHVYVAPGGASLQVSEGFISAHLPSNHSGDLPIDSFFRSLAQELGDRAVGIVLSGTGSDGTLGLKEIRSAGGLVMAQNEITAGHAGMPHSAMAALELDYVLPPGDMPQVLRAHAEKATRRLPSDSNEPSADVIAQLFELLRARTGHDFAHYKLSSVKRRITRRLNIHQLESGHDYLKLVKSRPSELEQLLKELLINVTSFFRDPEAFEILRTQIFPQLIAERAATYPIRVWVPGCATGEEAYSFAISLRECLDAANSHRAIQIFATDLDPDAIEQGRAGVFPQSIVSDVSAQRLERFFVRDDDCFRIKKEIRESLIFARQNIISDPPFTNLDLLSCRNLLIYLDASLQKRLMPLFHYTLRPQGVLFLGSSESVGSASSLFDCVDKRWKIFRRRESVKISPARVFAQRSTLQPPSREDPIVLEPRKAPEAGLTALAEKALLQHLLPPTVLIHERGEIVHIHGRTGQFLDPAPGSQAQANIFNMVRPSLHLELAVAIRQAKAAKGEEITYKGAQARSADGPITVNMRVRQLLMPEPLKGLLLVTFEQTPPEASITQRDLAGAEDAASGGNSAMRDWVQHLEREMSSVREVHQTTVEELETSNEELRSTNEELQSTNEELQSTNEELETSQEEMQSLTEELYTVNAELQSKVEELSRTNDDMKNLLNGTDIATLFLDSELRIKRFTQETTQIIRVISSDVGRPVSDLVSKLQYNKLIEDAEEVLRTLVYREAEVQGKDGRWYLMRILPYRTADNVIDGLVLTFVDITTVKAFQQRAERLMSALASADTSVFVQDVHLRFGWVSTPLYGNAPEKVVGKTDHDLLPKAEADQLHTLKQHVLASGQSVRKLLALTRGTRPTQHRIYLERVGDEEGRTVGLVGVLSNIEV